MSHLVGGVGAVLRDSVSLRTGWECVRSRRVMSELENIHSFVYIKSVHSKAYDLVLDDLRCQNSKCQPKRFGTELRIVTFSSSILLFVCALMPWRSRARTLIKRPFGDRERASNQEAVCGSRARI